MYLKIKIFNIDMAKLAIKGHKTRGKEVIEILKMLGGINSAHFNGDSIAVSYYIELDNSICIINNNVNYNTVFHKITLEEFLEKFPYKIGDKVIIKSKNKEAIIDKVIWSCDTITYWLKYDGFIEGNWRAEHLQPYKEETIETITIDDFKANTKEWLIDKLHGMIISDAVKTIGNIHDELHKPKYPKTFIEVLNFWHPDRRIEDDYQRCYKKDFIEKFQDLLYARDAYWKIAGEEMGLGKPWEPDWKDDEQFKYIIICRRGCIIRDTYTAKDVILAFSTEEMRDAFYENFKDLIELCKELL